MKAKETAHAQFQVVGVVWDSRRRCRREEGYMGQTCVKFEGRGYGVGHEVERRVNTTQIEKQEERGKNKKTRQKVKKPIFFRIWSHFASTPQPSQKAPEAALWTKEASRFRLSIGHLTDFLFI